MDMSQMAEQARAIVGLARLLSGETVDGLKLTDEEDGGLALAQGIAKFIRQRAGKIESALKNPL